ncbi:hypothetical protein SAMN05661091_2646 [Paenibacillus uliginis N3/975]|uniref:Uncharacterized protein n=1 Tax=Paenibacillus uliginis N3/975 TaxID=1313296 RepID=A0A1X7HEH1_9BACL|nr:hypothetical protein SAMN05661091_2646 [Paenibacillus uliginis N3/975]
MVALGVTPKLPFYFLVYVCFLQQIKGKGKPTDLQAYFC